MCSDDRRTLDGRKRVRAHASLRICGNLDDAVASEPNDAESLVQRGMRLRADHDGDRRCADHAVGFDVHGDGPGALRLQPRVACSEVNAETLLEEAGEDVVHVGEVAQGPRGCTVRGPAGRWGASETWEATHNA